VNFRSRFILITIFTLTISFILHKLFYDSRENKNWIGPYLSSAANLQMFGDFKIDKEEVISFKELNSTEQYHYQFSKSENLSSYTHNPIGYSYIIRFATTLFPFLGNSESLILFQVLVHLFISFLILYQFRTTNRFLLIFSIFYVCNPFILYFAVLNYYYFWQCIPGFMMIYIILCQPKRQWIVIMCTIILLFATLARPTIIFLSLFTLLLLYRKYSLTFATLSLTISTLFFILLNKPTEKIIWHTVYVGIGAYPNSNVPYLSDNFGYQLYRDSTGTELNASLGGNYYEGSVISRYSEITKNTAIGLFKKDPLLFIRNAISNTFQCFSIGYVKTNSPAPNIISAILGLIYCILLWKTNQKFIVVSILLYTFMFFLYYPPIPAYLFGAYILLVFSFYNVLSYYKPQFAPPITFRYPF